MQGLTLRHRTGLDIAPLATYEEIQDAVLDPNTGPRKASAYSKRYRMIISFASCCRSRDNIISQVHFALRHLQLGCADDGKPIQKCSFTQVGPLLLEHKELTCEQASGTTTYNWPSPPPHICNPSSKLTPTHPLSSSTRATRTPARLGT